MIEGRFNAAPPAGDPTGPMSIGVFDSGVGGLSILRSLRGLLPLAPMLYVGDSAYAPYGERSPHEVQARCELIVEHLVIRGAGLIVVACNTATAHAIEPLRQNWPTLAFVGVEPGVKPAVAQSRSRRIALMVTPATASSQRLRGLIERHAAGVHVHVQPCPGLADAIERGLLRGPELIDVLRPFCDTMRIAEVDTVALGCTHYSFVADAIRALLGPQIALIDTADAVAQRALQLWPADAGRGPTGEGRVFSTGAAATMQQLLRGCTGLETTRVESLGL